MGFGGACVRLAERAALEEVRRMAHGALVPWIDTQEPSFEQDKPPTPDGAQRADERHPRCISGRQPGGVDQEPMARALGNGL